ncbi:hypothetical protein D8674_042668 [Pyrus ussuriensis x Pyrus communis]|uniref:Uncharacterized protein n=1 Tax=Pyrus ussuriensis x Pyrus communis TaxID=2448454 RepID=A0A5N5I4I2_9ROSA|nr:hypothetical protein D8674_042668 [Pyrus ussuriensis x Pyrus communis]
MFVGATKRWKHHFCTIALLFVENHLLRLGAQNFEVVAGCFLRDKACTIGLLRRRLDNLLPGSLSIGTGSSMASLRQTETSNSNATTVAARTNFLGIEVTAWPLLVAETMVSLLLSAEKTANVSNGGEEEGALRGWKS